MKKIIIAVLAIFIVATMGSTVFAADTTIDKDVSAPTDSKIAVTFSMAPTYTVTIPAEIKLTEQTDKTYAGSGTILTSAIRLKKDNYVVISIVSKSNFIMKTSKGATQPYTATVDGKSNSLTSGNEIMGFGTSETPQSIKLNFAAANPTYAGDYSDTVTFNIKVVQQDA